MEMDESAAWDVIVVGAGIAGLAAGRVLAEAGLRVVVLEAQDRIGGRIFTAREDGETIELGAEFVHGRPQELWALIEEAGLNTYELTGDFLRPEDGRLLSAGDTESPGGAGEVPLERLKLYRGEDLSFLAYLDRIGISGAEREEALGYVEGFNAADAGEASILALGQQQESEDAIEGDRLWRISDGYDRLPEFVAGRLQAAGGRIVRNAPVAAVNWRRGSVRVQTPAGEFQGGKLIVSVPLGVLQAGTIGFDPEPGRLQQTIGTMRMGTVCRLVLTFQRRFWPATMSFLVAREALPPVWWTAHPAESLSVTGWVGGPRSRALLRLDDGELARVACSAFAKALGLDDWTVRSELKGMLRHDWQADPHSRGAYSWIPVGAAGDGNEPSSAARLAEPVEATVFFAGEHTDTTGHWGTVHAALRSGLRAARQVLEAA